MPIEKSQDITELVKALIDFQSKVVTVGRTVVNPFFGKKYADLASIMIEAQPILTGCGICASQFPDHVNGQPALTTILMHNSGQFVQATIPLPVSKITTVTEKVQTQKKPDKVTVTSEGFDPQEFGRAITYMRRYGYAAVLQIVIDEDDDGNKSSRRDFDRSEEPENVLIPSSPETATKIREIWKENGGTEDQLDTWVKKNNNGISLNDLPGDRQQAMLQVLESKKAERESKAAANLTTVAGEAPPASPETPVEPGEEKS